MIRVKSTDDTRLQSAIIVYADFVYLFGWQNRVKFGSHPTEPANYTGSYTYEYRITSVIFSTGLLTQIKLLYYRKLVK